MYIHNICSPIPEDWEDESKYPNKTVKVFKDDESYRAMKYFRPFILELWTYDAPWNTCTGKWSQTFAKCPKCGSYKVTIKDYYNLHPEVLAGSAGLEYTCDECGYSHKEAQIVS